MDQGTLEAIVTWLPLVVLVGLFVFIVWKSSNYYRKYDQNVADFMKTNAELVAVNREMAQTLVDIRTLLQTGKS